VVTADLEKVPSEVVAMFDEVAHGYDRTRSRLWLGRMNTWGVHMAAAARARPGDRILDVAAGTGTSGLALSARGARVTACDVSPGMLSVGRRRHPAMDFVVGDGRRLPFADGAFDAVTISFGLRNIADPGTALAEMRRVTRPGGRLVVCEFSMPSDPVCRALFGLWLRHAVPWIGRRVSTNPAAYSYLAESIRAWSTPAGLARRIGAAGWQKVAYRALDGGVVHLHTGVVPGAGSGSRSESA
jgi:demethylmenaquinone methyltransferase/2-methoxy-6-polyprenyl-1,4-benzoquinol methylase